MTLRISLRDGEKVVVDGAVIRSTGRTRLCIESKAATLRGRDLMEADDATTPVRQLYYACIAAHTDPHDRVAHQDRIVSALADVMATLQSPAAQATAASFARLMAVSDHNRALADCRTLMAMEGSSARPPMLPAVPPHLAA